jgi:hypothetical protein
MILRSFNHYESPAKAQKRKECFAPLRLCGSFLLSRAFQLSAVLAAHISIAACAPAAEIASNGFGGGPWTDPATWRGKTVPGSADDVVIQKNDIIVFDKSEADKLTCKHLQIDPKGGLTFKTGSGKLAFSVSNGIESFGVIRIDGTRSDKDHFEIRLVGDTADKRKIKLGKYGALLLFGKADLPDGRKNVALVAPDPADPKDELPMLVEAEGSVMVDWQRIAGHNVKTSIKKIDNTGARPNERLKIYGCSFTGASRLYCEGCDTPEFTRNTFENTGAKVYEEAVINAHTSPLVEIKGNTVKAPNFAIGIAVNATTDAVLVGNTIEKCREGIRGGYGLPSLMIKGATIKGCEKGLKLEGANGVIEDVLIEGAAIGINQENCTLQYNHVILKDLAKKAQPVLHEGGSMSLLNCNILPADIKMTPQKPPEKPGPPPVTCQQYIVVAAKQAPVSSLIEARTIVPAVPAGATDLNVRNSPAALVDGLTPPPKSLSPLIVKAWTFDYAGKVQPAPEYGIRLLGPAPKEGAERPLLKAINWRPPENGFRADLKDPTPTLEVK